MLRGVVALGAFLGVLLLLSSAAWAGTDDAVISMTATVDSFAEWADPAPVIAFVIGFGDHSTFQGFVFILEKSGDARFHPFFHQFSHCPFNTGFTNVRL